MKITFITQGCRANKSDTGWLSVLAKNKNFKVEKSYLNAQAVIINSCTVTHGADRDCRQLIRKIRRENPQALICLVGCFSQMSSDEIQAIEGVDYIGGSGHKEKVLDFLEQNVRKQEAPVKDEMTFEKEGFLCPDELPLSETTTRLFLKIQDGCNHRCTYCIIHQARGASRSMSCVEVMRLLNQASDKGIKEVVLTGIDLGNFGGGVLVPGGLCDLLKHIDQECDIPRVRLSSLAPREYPDELLEVVASSQRICPSFHISLQHGHPRILKAMGRPYSPDLFRSRVARIKELMPDATIGLDVIVGFPGEDDESFKALVRLLNETEWTRGHFFPYSARQGTPSATMPSQVPDAVKTKRMKRLLKLNEKRFRLVLESWVGQKVDVLVEREERDRQELWLKGRTREFLPIRVRRPLDAASGSWNNRILSTYVASVAQSEGNQPHLFGQR